MNKRSAIFFDLDGTLLPMDLEVFTQTYFKLLAARFPEYDPKSFVSAVWQGTKAMTANDGSMTNEARFWSVFSGVMGQEVLDRQAEFEAFYRTDFNRAKAATGPNPLARQAVALAHRRAETVVLATNPLFPVCAVESRLGWVGLTPADFDYITTYENSASCKPNPAYYKAICKTLDLDPSDCLMIGNDLQEDAQGASQAGLQVHIVTDCLITHGLALDGWSHSDFAGLPEAL